MTGENGNVSYQLTATPGAGQKLKGITVNGTEVAETVAAGGAYTLEGYGQTKVAQKVYFGKKSGSPQAWWIAGYQESGYGTNNDEGALVLLCDPNTPMSDSENFNNSSSDYSYNSSWGCTYSSGAPTTVNANHYGGSDIRKTLQGYLTDSNGEPVTDRFSAAEQGLMKPTTVWTWDKENNKFYSTTDKLYLGAGDYDDDKYITVGANDVTSGKTGNAAVNNGLKVGLVSATGPAGSPYISGGQWFWLRSPSASASNRCVPACALNLESVIFASAAAPAAASSSALSDGVYFRFADDTTTPKISTTATATDNAIAVTKGSEGGDIYLYIQGNDGTSDWVYSKQITQSETINASDDIHTGLTSFANCRVWLETTDDNVTYAKKVATTAPAEMESFIDVESLATESTKYGLFTNAEIAVEFEEKTAISPTVSIAGWNFKGRANSPRVSGNNGGGAVTYEYKVKGTADETYSSEVPTTVGKYTVRATIAATDEYKGGTATADFEIKHAVYSTLNGLPRVLSGVGGEAGYRYNTTTEEPEFYCEPKPGYKLEGTTIGADGTKYVRFKIV